MFSEVIDLRLQSVELFLGRIVSGPLDAVVESTGTADLQREREARYKQDREGWRARLRQYASARDALVTPGDGWWPIDDEDD